MILTDLGIDILTKIMSMVVQMRKNQLARVQAVWRGAIQRLQDSSLYVASNYKNIQYGMQQPSEAVISRVRVGRRVMMDHYLKREGWRPPFRWGDNKYEGNNPTFLRRRAKTFTREQYQAIFGPSS